MEQIHIAQSSLGYAHVTAISLDHDSYVQGRLVIFGTHPALLSSSVQSAHMLHNYATVHIMPTPQIFVLEKIYTLHC